jgi:hypothetical protein
MPERIHMHLRNVTRGTLPKNWAEADDNMGT